MSSIVRLNPLSTATLRAAASRPTPTILPAGAARYLTSSTRKERGPVETTKDTLHKADRAVSDAMVKGIDKGQSAAEKVRKSVGKTSSAAKSEAEKAKTEAEKMEEKAKETKKGWGY